MTCWGVGGGAGEGGEGGGSGEGCEDGEDGGEAAHHRRAEIECW